MITLDLLRLAPINRFVIRGLGGGGGGGGRGEIYGMKHDSFTYMPGIEPLTLFVMVLKS